MASQTTYQSYLLRIWQVQDGQQKYWRVSLTHIGTGKQHNFADLQTLVDFLKENAQLLVNDLTDNPPGETKMERKK